MATFVELAQGNSYSRSSEGGASVDTAKRTFKVMRDTITETIDIPALIGIDVGDAYSNGNQVPCVGWEARPDGDSRMVLIVTFRYRSTPGGVDGSGGGGSDPKLRPPEIRPALYQMTSSLQEVPSAAASRRYITYWGGFKPPLNDAGDLLEGMTRLEPIIDLTITQYSYTDQSGILAYTGYINSDVFTFSGHSVPIHTCMFRGLNVTPYVESGFRGFQLEFQFSFRMNVCGGIYGYNGDQAIGWDHAIVNAGYNIINEGLGDPLTEQEHLNYTLDEQGNIASPRSLKSPGKKMRAQVPASGVDGGERQINCASPVLLDEDGRPQSRSLDPIIYRFRTQPEMVFGNNFSAFGINSFY